MMNRHTEARVLLYDIEKWCERTSTKETSLGRVLYRHPGFVGLLRKRLTVTVEKETEVRAFMKEHPRGYGGPLPKTSGYGVTRPRPRPSKGFDGGFRKHDGPEAAVAWAIMGEAMEAAVRKLDGLEEFKLPQGVAEAAIRDGRWYPEFLADLISKGLEQWKAEHSASGEPR